MASSRYLRQTASLTAAALLAVAASSTSAAAQETRAEVIARAKAEKAKDLEPYRPGRIESFVTWLGRGVMQPASGVYPSIGSVYSGGGLAAGPGLRVFTGDRAFFDARAMYSIRQYKLADAAFVAPSVGSDRLSLRLNGGWLDATQIGYFGLGMGSSEDDRANFRMKQTYGGAELALRPAGPIVLAAGAAYEDYAMERGLGRRPSIEEVFTPATAPGLGISPTYTHLTGSAGIDSRPATGYARRGTLLQVAYHTYRDRDEVYSFDRVDVEAVQHIPITRDNWVLSLHGRMQSTANDTDAVPYFLLPSLGSGSTLRAYPTGRFRDRHALLLQAEWRWLVNKYGLDMALFYDAGKVAARREDLDLKNLKSDYGIGLRFHGLRTTALRIDLARSRDGLNLVFSAGAAF